MKSFHLLLVTGCLAACLTKATEKPDFGVILNDDGDLCFMCPDPVQAEAYLRANVAGLAGSAVGTFVISIGSGSDTLNYPTKIANTVGWRRTKYEDDSDLWRMRMENARACLAAGMDPIRIAGEEARSIGLKFIPSQRMNDSHFMSDPFNFPLTGEFWLKNYKELCIRDAPVDFREGYGNLLDYSKPEVRAYRLGVAYEAIERYEDIIDGFELDFNRVQIFFPRDKAQERAHLITQVVRDVRKKLDEVSQQQGRPMYLFVRIPPSLADCHWAGLEVEKWMGDGLVDLVSPSQLMTLAQDMPIADLIEEAHHNGVLVYPSIYPRTGWRSPLNPEDPTGPLSPVGRTATLAEIYGAAATYDAMGADGFYLFNFYGVEQGRRPYPDWFYAMLRTLVHPKALEGASLDYFITQTYYHDDANPTYAYHKQLPRTLGVECEGFILLLGKAPGEGAFPLRNCILRLGGSGEGSERAPTVYMNGKKLDNENQKSSRRPVPAADVKRFDNVAGSYWLLPIDDPALLKAGENALQIIWPGVTITDVELAVNYHQFLSRLWTRKDTPLNGESIKIQTP